MKILFTGHNVTTDGYLDQLKKNNAVYTVHDKRHIKYYQDIAEVKVVPVRYLLSYFSYVANFFKLNLVAPQYILNFERHLRPLQKDGPLTVVVADINHFLLWQFIRYQRKYPDTKIFIWSETRSWPERWYTKFVMKFFWQYFVRNICHVEKVFVFTKEGKDFFAREIPGLTTVIMPAAVDGELFYPESNKVYLPGGKLRLIMNARYIPLKEHQVLLQALKTLKDEHRGFIFSLTLIGRGGELKSDIIKKITDLGLEEEVTVLDAVPYEGLRDIYLQHDVLVLPSNREAIGMVVPEAMACGLATITSEAVGANTFVQEGKTGYIFETGNISDLAAKILLLNDEKRLRDFGGLAARVISESYTKEVLGAKLEESLRS